MDKVKNHPQTGHIVHGHEAIESAQRLADRLGSEHEELTRRLQDLSVRARSGDPRECDAVWSDFATRLERHMAFEEQHILPRYEQAGAIEQVIADTLRSEHAALRGQCEHIGLDLQLHLASAEVIDGFLAALRQHAHRERETLDVWLVRAATAEAHKRAAESEVLSSWLLDIE